MPDSCDPIPPLPGEELVAAGLADLARGIDSPNALLVAIAATRLRELGLEVPEASQLPREPELALYRALGTSETDPYYAYNAAKRRLDSFVSALEARHRRSEASATAGHRVAPGHQ